MASVTAGPGDAAERAVFVRKATGLVRGWSTRDAFIYAAFSINLVTLGLYIFGYAPFIPGGSLIWAVLLAGGYLVVQGITYASLIAAMPRAGGDYVWISRVLGGGIGFVLAITGWWFILWLWVPIYANILNVEVLGPMAAIVGWSGAVDFLGKDDGIFAASVATAILASGFIALGMRSYAKVQKFCFYGGLVGLAVMMLLLLFNSKASFITHFNEQSKDLYGVDNAYQATLAAGLKDFTRSRDRLVRVRRHVRADPDDGVLQPVVELGRDAVRRGARRVGLPPEHLRDGGRAGGDLDRRRDPVPAVLEDVRLGLLPRGQQRVLGRDDPDRRVAVPGPAGGVVPAAVRCSSSS